jgi:hypothetical protein
MGVVNKTRLTRLHLLFRLRVNTDELKGTGFVPSGLCPSFARDLLFSK